MSFLLKVLPWVEPPFHFLVDRIHANWPQDPPEPHAVEAIQTIAHRGTFGHPSILENTLEAFDYADQAGVWALELDIRWSKDLEPIVHHDPHLQRVFGSKTLIKDWTWPDLHQAFPQIPHLRDVLAHYGKKRHLLIELKPEPYPDPEHQSHYLQELLSVLTPQVDYHLMSTSHEVLTLMVPFPNHILMPIALLNGSALSQISLEQGYAGISGHYYLLSSTHVQTHLEQDNMVLTGHISSSNVLAREIHRGVTGVVSNDPFQLEQLKETLVQEEL